MENITPAKRDFLEVIAVLLVWCIIFALYMKTRSSFREEFYRCHFNEKLYPKLGVYKI